MHQIWVDIGGTFTDAIFPTGDGDDSRLGGDRMIKVLSSGRVPVRVVGRNGKRFTLSGIPDPNLADDFWKGATLELGGQSFAIQGSHEDQVNLDQAALDQVGNEISDETTPGSYERSGSIESGIPSPVLAARLLLNVPLGSPMPPVDIRLGTTRGTNALLTRGGADTTLLTTTGFGDVLRIGEQDRPQLYTFDVAREPTLTEHTIEIDERIDADGTVYQTLDEKKVRDALLDVHDQFGSGRSLAISLVNSHVCSTHEQRVEQIARDIGFTNISRSSEVSPLMGYVARTETTTLDAYLNPILSDYVRDIVAGFEHESSRVQWMTSAGNLVSAGRSNADSFRGRDSILSGPAGGVVALGHVARASKIDAVVGLDMGGTSTDVSHYDVKVGRRTESRVAGIRVMTPMMDIETVAAGGGSVCSYHHRRLHVGPESAGADPGPACYGRGGPLCVTDVNVLLGRLGTERFPFALDLDAAGDRLSKIYQSLDPGDRPATELDLAESFLQIAIAHMAEAVRTVTTARGNDVRKMGLVGFGGAAGGHVCRIADELGMRTIIDHPASGLMSALGIGLSQPGTVSSVGIYQVWDAASQHSILSVIDDLSGRTLDKFSHQQSVDEGDCCTDIEIAARYLGTESAISISLAPSETLAERFHAEHRKRFGYEQVGTSVEIASAQVEVRLGAESAQGAGAAQGAELELREAGPSQPPNELIHQSSPTVSREDLRSGETIVGPRMIVSDFSTLVVEAGWTATMQDDRRMELIRDETHEPPSAVQSSLAIADVEIYARRLQGIADSMGEVLRLTSMSVNVKQRRDYSCAVFSGDGKLLAGALHVPVHLGAMSGTVREMMRRFTDWKPGDAIVTNDPFAGGSHLPDVTIVQPVFAADDASDSNRPMFFVASRAHHAEIGGITPGSMPPSATSLEQEGVLIRPMKLIDQGEERFDAIADVLKFAKYPTRRLDENLADLRAQVAAGIRGIEDLQSLAADRSRDQVDSLAARWLDVAGDAVAAWIDTLPGGETSASDRLDDDDTDIRVAISKQGKRLKIHLSSSPVHRFGFNAPPSISMAAVLYVVRCFCGNDLPLCDGVLRDVDVTIDHGMLSPKIDGDGPSSWPAVVAGNVETSNRVVDVLIAAICNWPGSKDDRRLIAASGGTMNNTLFGDDTFGYYETMGGGSGATDRGDGESAIQTHMTNTRMTDVEVLESRLPIRLHRFAVRKGSGGDGDHRGGDGLVREFEFLRPVTVSLLTKRRTTSPPGIHGSPPGIHGGGSGQPGRNIRVDVSADHHELAPCVSYDAAAGERLIVETPGGGGVS